MVSVIQPAFSVGELSPRLYARVDLAKYHTAVALGENCFVDYRGGMSNRSGLKWIGRAGFGGASTSFRLIPFSISTTLTYILEFGSSYLRVIRNGVYAEDITANIQSISNANPGVVTTTAPHGMSTSDVVRIQGVNGMTQINNRYFKITVLGPTQFILTDVLENSVNTTSYSAYTSAGTAGRVYTLLTSYPQAVLPELKFAQFVDVMTITHPSFAPAQLTRVSDANWTLATIGFGATMTIPTGFAGARIGGAAAADETVYYAVTAVSVDGRESLSSINLAAVSVAVNFTDSYVQLTWVAVAGAASYNVYAAHSAAAVASPGSLVYGYIGSVTSTTFNDVNIVPNPAFTPPAAQNPLSGGGNLPRSVAYFQQRQVFASTDADPQNIWFSVIADYTNMNRSFPIKDSDAIAVTLVSNQATAIEHMVSMPSGLIVLTQYGAWQVSGGGVNQPVTPSNIIAQPQAYNGISGRVPPIVINYDIIYVAARGNSVRNLSYNFYTNVYTGTDISVLSNHLFEGKVIAEAAYAESPFKLLWMTRTDGVALSLAILKEQEVLGWSHHVSRGASGSDLILSVASVIENDEDAVYFAIQRTIGATTVTYVERMASRILNGNIANGWFLDAAKQYSGASAATLFGFDHLAGTTVTAVVNGITVYDNLSVAANGSVTLPVAVTSCIIGYKTIANFQTLRIDLGEPTQQGKRKLINSLTVRINETYGIKIGSSSDNLQSWSPSTLNFSGEISNSLYSGDIYRNIGSGWNTEGQIYIRQDLPYPMTILGVIPEVIPGDTVRR